MSLTYFTNKTPQQITGQALLSDRAGTQTSNYFYVVVKGYVHRRPSGIGIPIYIFKQICLDNPFILQPTIIWQLYFEVFLKRDKRILSQC